MNPLKVPFRKKLVIFLIVMISLISIPKETIASQPTDNAELKAKIEQIIYELQNIGDTIRNTKEEMTSQSLTMFYWKIFLMAFLIGLLVIIIFAIVWSRT